MSQAGSSNSSRQSRDRGRENKAQEAQAKQIAELQAQLKASQEAIETLSKNQQWQGQQWWHCPLTGCGYWNPANKGKCAWCGINKSTKTP